MQRNLHAGAFDRLEFNLGVGKMAYIQLPVILPMHLNLCRAHGFVPKQKDFEWVASGVRTPFKSTGSSPK
jgi:hypothetical protein